LLRQAKDVQAGLIDHRQPGASGYRAGFHQIEKEHFAGEGAGKLANGHRSNPRAARIKVKAVPGDVLILVARGRLRKAASITEPLRGSDIRRKQAQELTIGNTFNLSARYHQGGTKHMKARPP